jgi:hypothetical protein
VIPSGANDVVLLLDADLGNSAVAANALLEPVLQGEADMSIAILPSPARRSGFGLVLGLAREAIARLGGDFQAQAPLSGQRALTWPCLQTLRPFADRYGVEVAMTVMALRAGYRVVEIPAAMRHRASGLDIYGIFHRGRQYLDVRRAIRQLEKAD